MFDSSLTPWLSMEPATEWGLTVGVRIYVFQWKTTIRTTMSSEKRRTWGAVMELGSRVRWQSHQEASAEDR